MSLPLAFLSDWHIIVLFGLVVLLFGGKKLPEVARGLGEAMREFKKASRDMHDEPQQTASRPTTPPTAQPPAAAPQQPSEPKQG
jgi:sec-independent protein translocase protein TatA